MGSYDVPPYCSQAWRKISYLKRSRCDLETSADVPEDRGL